MLRTILTFATCGFIGAQLYHYFGYPLFLLLVSGLLGSRVRSSEFVPAVTLVTAAYNEADIIARKLDNSLALHYPRLEVIVASDGSTDATLNIVKSYAARGVRALSLPVRSGKAAAINLAAGHAVGDLLIISDANAVLERDAVCKLVRAFADPKVGCVCGEIGVSSDAAAGLIARSEGIYWRYEAMIRRGESRLGANVGTTGALLAIRRSLFSAIPEGTINDDLFLALHVLRRGYASIFEPAAKAWRMPSQSRSDETRRRRRIVDGRLQQLWDPGSWPWRSPIAVFTLFSHKCLRLLLPYCMIGALVANSAAYLLPPVPLVLHLTFAGQLTFYALAAIGYWAEPVAQRLRLPALAYYIVAGNAAALGAPWRLARGRSTALWEKAAR
jgi:biofilm PGA synthesis N-glycosyltransferase PgaC